MYKLKEVAEGDYPTLINDNNLFHEALKLGEERYHVKNDKGDDFDLVLYENNRFDKLHQENNFLSPNFFPPYNNYDENNKESLWLKILEGRDKVVIEEINEYTVAIIKVVLNFTQLDIVTADERISWFFEPNERIKIVEELPEYDKNTMFWIQKEFRMGMMVEDAGIWDATSFFHNIFFLQDLLHGKNLEDLKYFSFELDSSNGIGQILSILKKFNKAFENFGLKVHIDSDTLGSYSTEMLNRYFSFKLDNEDANESNTLVIENFPSIFLTHFIFYAHDTIDKDILGDEFIQDLDEYYEAVFGDQKVLGVLIRGTDYIVNELGGFMMMASADQMIPTINEWLEEENYDRIFLATEDADVLEAMREEYGSKLIGISQDRKRVSDFDESKTLLELEENNSENFEASVEDMLVNYFYALYILSKCDSFICSGWCNGFDIVCDFNEGKFNKLYKFSIGL